MTELQTKNPWRRHIEHVEIFAHKGGAFEGPESTIYAAARSLDAGATALEWDVHRSADGHFVISHDPTVDRTTNGRGAIANLTLDELKSLDPGFWFVDGQGVVPQQRGATYSLRGRMQRDSTLRIPTIEEIAGEFRGIRMNFDLKADGYELEFIDRLAQLRLIDTSITTSFEKRRTQELRRKSPHADRLQTSASRSELLPFAYFPSFARKIARHHVAVQLPALGAISIGDLFHKEHDANSHDESVWARSAIYAGAATLPPNVELGWGPKLKLRPEHVVAAHHHGLAVHVWTINDPGEMATLLGWNVDGIITDTPSTLSRVVQEELARRHSRYAKTPQQTPPFAP